MRINKRCINLTKSKNTEGSKKIKNKLLDIFENYLWKQI